MERHEYEDDTIPHPIAQHQKKIAEEKAMKVLERKERPHLDHDEMSEIEGGQHFPLYNFLR